MGTIGQEISHAGSRCVLSHALEMRLRKTLEVILEESRRLHGKDVSGRDPQTMAILQIDGEVIAIVRMRFRSAASLSRRQRQISQLVARGLTNKEIAQTLVLRRPTVAAHLQRIFKKLEITTRTGLAGIASLLS